jgi:hypothetical protein
VNKNNICLRRTKSSEYDWIHKPKESESKLKYFKHHEAKKDEV